MCFSIESSLSAWATANVISVYLYCRNKNYDRWNAGFISTFTTIQLLEGGVWYSLENKKKSLNDLLTRLILIALLLQPLVQTYLGYTHTKSAFLGILSYIFIGMLVWGLLRVCKSPKGSFSSSVGPKGHLVWNSTESSNFIGGKNEVLSKIIPIFYFIGISLPLFFMKNHKGLPLLIVGIGTAAYSLLYASGKEFSSMWCFTAVLYAFTSLLV